MHGRGHGAGARAAIAVAVAVVCALVAAFAGVAALELGAPPPPGVDGHAGLGPVAAPLVRALAPDGGGRREGEDATPAAGARRAAPSAAAVDAERVVPIAVRRQLGDARHRHYTGPLEVFAGVRCLLRTTLVNSQPLAVTVPAGCAALRFVAPDHADAELTELPPPAPSAPPSVVAPPARAQPTPVVLRPLAGFVVRVLGAPAVVDSFLQVHVGDFGLHASAARKGEADDGVLDVPFVAGVACPWTAGYTLGARRLQLEGTEPPLQPRERRELVLDFAAVPTQRVRLVGPSAELLPHVAVVRRWHWQAGFGAPAATVSPVVEAITLDANGCAEVVRRAGDTWSAANVELAPAPAGDELWLRPREPLFGLGLRGADDAPVQSTLFDAASGVLSARAELHVVPRARVVGARLVSHAHGVARTITAADVPVAGDVAWLPSEPAAKGELRVRVGGAPPAADVLARLRVVVSATAVQEQASAAAPEVTFVVPGGLGYTVAWRLDGRRIPIATDRALPAGGTLDVDATWPCVAAWRGVVTGFGALPSDRRWTRVAWSDGDPFGGARLSRDGDGTFGLDLLDGEALPERCRLVWSMTPVAARVVDVDAAARTFRVEPVDDVRWVPARVDAPAPWQLAIAHGGGRACWPQSMHDNQFPLPVARGDTLHGALTSGRVGPGARVLAWWTIADGVDVLDLRAAPGRSIEVRAPADAAATARLVGPHGQRDFGTEIPAGGRCSVWVPDGTRALETVRDGGATWREHAVADVVIVD